MGWVYKCILGLLFLNPVYAFLNNTAHEFLRGTTMSVYSSDFRYDINYFQNIQQYDTNNEWIADIGTFNQYIGNDIYLLNDGTYCDAIGGARTAQLTLLCGNSQTIINEKTICYYEFEVSDPSICINPSEVRFIPDQTDTDIITFTPNMYINNNLWLQQLDVSYLSGYAHTHISSTTLTLEYRCTNNNYGQLWNKYITSSETFEFPITTTILNSPCYINELQLKSEPIQSYTFHNIAGYILGLPPPPSPSPPPPSPPPPSPPPPPPPPSEYYTTVQTVQAVVQQTITTAIATSVTTVMASSISSSVAGSSSVPGASPVGLVTMISHLQMIDMKTNLQIGKIPDAFKGIAGSVPWINMNVAIVKFPKMFSRKLLAIDPNQIIWEESVSFLVLYVATISTITILHYIFNKYKPQKGMLGFPQLEFMLLLLFMNPMTKHVGKLFSTKETYAILFGISLLLILPIPMICYSFWIIYKYVIKTLHAKFIVMNPVQTMENNPFNFIKRGLWSVNIGHWKDVDNVVEKYGIFFENVRGPLYVPTKNMIVWNKDKQAYTYGKWYVFQEKFKYIRVFYKPYLLIKNLFVILFLQGYTYSSQVFFLIVFYNIHIWLLLLIAPFNSHKAQLTEFAISLCELGTYICGAISLMIYEGIYTGVPKVAIEKSLFVMQLLSVGIQVLSQLTILITIVALLKDWVAYKFFMDKMIQKNKELLLQKKYGNRWLYIVHNRTLKGFPKPTHKLKAFKTFH